MSTIWDENVDKIASGLNRIADALEQLALGQLDHTPADPYPARLAPADEIADLPPVRPPVPVEIPLPPQPVGPCPVHNVPWKLVPAGYSQAKQKAYNAFWACPTQGCSQRPPR